MDSGRGCPLQRLPRTRDVFVLASRESSNPGSTDIFRKQLYRTQPAISQSIRKLESEVGEPLLQRASRDGSLTDAGLVLKEYAEKLLNLRSEATSPISELRQLQSGKLSIAANEFTSVYLLAVLEQFRRLCPMI